MTISTQSASFAANIPKYFAYLSLKGFGFGMFAALWLIFLQQQHGLTLSQAAFVDVTFFVAAALGEVPTGIVADAFGRKKSMTIGAAMLCFGVVGWIFAPTLPLLVIAYISMGVGLTFLTGAEDALLYESVQLAGRAADYMRLAGRASAVFLGALALGSVVGGFLTTLHIFAPFITSAVSMFLMLLVVMTLKEPQLHDSSGEKPRKPFFQVLKEAVALVRIRPTLRYPMLYLALVPLASFMLEGVFIQAQALALGVPVAVIGVIWAGITLINMAGATWSDRVKDYVGEGRLLYLAPLINLACVVLLATFQLLPSLILIAVMGFLTAALRPLLLGRIQGEVSDDIRATIISLQSLMFTFLGMISQPSLGFVADHYGLPVAYFVMAGVISVLIGLLLWVSRAYFPQAEIPALTPITNE